MKIHVTSVLKIINKNQYYNTQKMVDLLENGFVEWILKENLE